MHLRLQRRARRVGRCAAGSRGRPRLRHPVRRGSAELQRGLVSGQIRRYRWLTLGTIVAITMMPHVGSAQGRCIRAYGSPACNTDSIPPVFARTGWRTASLDHITFRVAEPKKEAAFYAALMGWKTRSENE